LQAASYWIAPAANPDLHDRRAFAQTAAVTNAGPRWIVPALLAVAIAAAAGYLLWQQQAARDARPVAAPAPAAQQPAPAPAPQILYPLPQGEAPSLPTLEMSDTSMRELLAALFGRSAFDALFAQQDIVRRIVATVDNLPRDKAAQRLMPLRSAAGGFRVAGTGESLAVAADNAARYAPFIAAATAVDTAALVAAYIRNYPLFQQAYRELGYPSGYFNDRLVQALDDMLAAPAIEGPVMLAQRKVLYEYADPALEARSAGQKIMMRIGTANAQALGAKLREIRGALTAPPKPPSGK